MVLQVQGKVVTKLIAKKLKLLYLDTGAMYRSLSWLMIKEGIDYKKEKKLQNILKDISIVFKSNTNSHQDVYVNNYCVCLLYTSPSPRDR